MTKAERETLKAEYITGDYRTLKEFAEAKGLSYIQLRKIAAQDRWTENKTEHAEQIGNKIRAKASELAAKEIVRNIEAVNTDALDFVRKANEKIAKLMEVCARPNDVNTLMLAYAKGYELEKDILTVDKTKTAQDEALDKLTTAILTSAFDDVNGDDSNG